jgi:hypothetical protein
VAKNKDVTFIRRGGRVIPIRKKDAGKQLVKAPGSPPPPPKKKERKSLFKAAGFLGSGALASLFGGSALAEFHKEAEFTREAAKSLFKRGTAISRQAAAAVESKQPFLKEQAKTFTKAGAFQRARGMKVAARGRFVGGGALTIGATLIGMGLYESYKQLVGRELSSGEQFATQAGGAAAATLGAIEFGKKMKISTSAAKKIIPVLLRLK